MKLQTAKGVGDIAPSPKMLQNKVMGIIQRVFETYGFQPLETPLLERYETLAAKFAAGEDSDALKEIFKLKDQGKRNLGLRFDLTVPLARYVATNPNLKMPFKRYEIGPVFRDGPIKAGRMRQFWQCDVDIVGSNSLLAEAEILSLAKTVFARLNLDVIIKINNRKVLNGILEQAGIKKKEEAIIAIDKLTKIGEDGVSAELRQKGFTGKQVESIFSLIQEGISLKELKQKLKNEEGQEGIKELEELFSYAELMDVKQISFDVSLARGLTYYTGPVYEVFLRKGKITSSLAAGGRWDKMIGNFSNGRDVCALGISFGIVPILESLSSEEVILTKVYVLPINTVNQSLGIVQQLRENGIPASLAFSKGVSKGLEYAGSLNIPYVLISGERELKKKKVLLRDMKTGKEELLSLKEVIKKLK